MVARASCRPAQIIHKHSEKHRPCSRSGWIPHTMVKKDSHAGFSAIQPFPLPAAISLRTAGSVVSYASHGTLRHASSRCRVEKSALGQCIHSTTGASPSSKYSRKPSAQGAHSLTTTTTAGSISTCQQRPVRLPLRDAFAPMLFTETIATARSPMSRESGVGAGGFGMESPVATTTTTAPGIFR